MKRARELRKSLKCTKNVALYRDNGEIQVDIIVFCRDLYCNIVFAISVYHEGDFEVCTVKETSPELFGRGSPFYKELTV